MFSTRQIAYGYGASNIINLVYYIYSIIVYMFILSYHIHWIGWYFLAAQQTLHNVKFWSGKLTSWSLTPIDLSRIFCGTCLAHPHFAPPILYGEEAKTITQSAYMQWVWIIDLIVLKGWESYELDLLCIWYDIFVFFILGGGKFLLNLSSQNDLTFVLYMIQQFAQTT